MFSLCWGSLRGWGLLILEKNFCEKGNELSEKSDRTFDRCKTKGDNSTPNLVYQRLKYSQGFYSTRETGKPEIIREFWYTS